MRDSSPSSLGHFSRWRRRVLRPWVVVASILVVVQSITITPPIVVRYVDADLGVPIASLPVTVVWRLDAGHLAGSLPSTVLKMRRLTTDPDGDVRIGLAVMLHAPNFPFGLNYRRASSLPTLYVVDQRYEARITANDPYDWKRPAPISVLSLQRTSVDGTTVALSSQMQGDADVLRSIARSALHRAETTCPRRWLCQED